MEDRGTDRSLPAEIRRSLGRMIAEYGAISLDEVEIRPEPPIKEWIDLLTRPAISLYIFAVRENLDLRGPGMRMVRGSTDAVRRPPPRRIDLRFMVSALTTDIEDEDALLWRMLATLIKYAEWPAEIVPQSIRQLSFPVTARIEPDQEGGRLADVWSGLAARPRPALWYVVTVPLDLDLAFATPLGLTRVARTFDRDSGRELKRTISISGTVRDGDGAPVVGATITVAGRGSAPVVTAHDGRFALNNLAEGPLRLRVKGPGGRTHVA